MSFSRLVVLYSTISWFIHRDFDDGGGVTDIEDSIVCQDMMLARALQQGMNSAGYKDSNFAGQETRLRFFHEALNDYLNAGVK